MGHGQDERPSPLEGIRVLDLGTMIGGPFAATMLADFGAEVIKIELPGIGDGGRNLGYKNPKEELRSLWWLSLGRNKRCVTLDIRTDEGRQLFKEMVSKSDVVIESFRPGTMEKWGLGYEDLKKINSKIIMLRVSGFGQEGPRSTQSGYDRVAQAYAGSTYVTGYPDGPPVRSGIPIGDYGAGIMGCIGILLALYYRDTVGTGEGQMIDVSLYDPIAIQWMDMITAYDILGVVTERSGNKHPNLAPGDVYKTSDGKWIHISGTNDATFARIMKALGRPELAEDPRFNTNQNRVLHREELDQYIVRWVESHTLEEVVKVCEIEGVPASPIHSVEDIMKEEHMRIRETIIELEDPVLGKYHMQGVVPKLFLTPGKVKFAGANLGQHNKEVYEELLGLTETQLNDYKSRGIM